MKTRTIILEETENDCKLYLTASNLDNQFQGVVMNLIDAFRTEVKKGLWNSPWLVTPLSETKAWKCAGCGDRLGNKVGDSTGLCIRHRKGKAAPKTYHLDRACITRRIWWLRWRATRHFARMARAPWYPTHRRTMDESRGNSWQTLPRYWYSFWWHSLSNRVEANNSGGGTFDPP